MIMLRTTTPPTWPGTEQERPGASRALQLWMLLGGLPTLLLLIWLIAG